ncbi:CDK-activating kinase assembly factor MAT1-domain-containing protein [Xylariaceae sp. FL0662B]|nr:CDK-activating kinase assembly factor MAT1-domain-containing protein [Xylariaceae sp. FL0662B]
MSRKPLSSATTVTKTAEVGDSTIPSDICPVCKRVRYFNADMEFLINPECYHAMCSNCVENIFGPGPAQCPYAACTKTLRKNRFRPAFFGDLDVEREVDIRRRVNAVFNMVEDDFKTLGDYNNFLQTVEDLTFDLLNGGEAERKKAEDELKMYEQKHREDIERNKKKGREADARRQKRDAEEAKASRARRLEEAEEERRVRAEEASINAEVMEALARGESGTAAEIQARIVAEKRARISSLAGSRFVDMLNPAPPAPSMLSIRGLKDKNQKTAEEEDAAKPYDPFDGLSLEPTRYRMHDESAYPNPFLDDARSRNDHCVPGYDVGEYMARALYDAFAGLGVVIDDEKAAA